ncbi:MAG: Unknown protein [uncultured Sulfurovum sp.]|uniref:Uncharacterized protein n=1 Tax=uncultured Sulfurovum sp. TaxID=269237 RepID=A0A6S6U0N0_9BACT|nr:MAG: Unknown protein [uncultured Sulfurovum sp.]
MLENLNKLFFKQIIGLDLSFLMLKYFIKIDIGKNKHEFNC